LGELVNLITRLAQRLPEETKVSVKISYESINIEPPIIDSSKYLSFLGRSKNVKIVDTMARIIKSLEDLLIAENIPINIIFIQPFSKIQLEQAVSILEYVWKSIYEILEFILKESKSEDLIKKVLDDILRLICMVGSVNISSGLENMVYNLCSWQFPVDWYSLDWKSVYKYLYICSSIIKLAQSYNKVLTKKSWVHILNVYQKIGECTYDYNEAEEIQFNKIETRVTSKISKYLKDKSITPDSALIVKNINEEEEKDLISNNEEVKQDNKENYDMKENDSLKSIMQHEFALSNKDVNKSIEYIKNAIDSIFVFSSLFDVNIWKKW